MLACTAHKASTGEPCKNPAIRGGTVCVNHGGKAPQVRAKALERLAALVDPTITYWQTVLENESLEPRDRIRVGMDILDRAGFKPTDKLRLSGDSAEPLEIVISRPVPATD